MTCNCDCNVFLPTEFVPLADFYYEVEAEAPTVPQNIAERYILEAAIELARETNCLTRQQAVKPQSMVADYYLEPLGGEQIARMVSVCVDGDEYSINKQNDRMTFHHWWFGSSWRFAPPFQLIAHPAPKVDCDKCIIVTYAAMPDRTACRLDKEFSVRHHDTVVSGALSRILKLSRGQKDPYPWTDKPQADWYLRRFQRQKADVKTDVALGYATGNTSTFTQHQIDAGF